MLAQVARELNAWAALPEGRYIRRDRVRGLITTTHRPPRVLALVNYTTLEGVNYARSEPPGLVRVPDVLWLAAGFVCITAACAGWYGWRQAWRVDRAIDLEAWRTAKRPAPLH